MFVTLKSTDNLNVQEAQSAPANFTNSFSSPLELGPGMTIELVSVSVNRPDLFEINGSNWEIAFRRGYGLGNLPMAEDEDTTIPRYVQHVLKLPQRTYSGAELALEIKAQLNQNTLLYDFQGNWDCRYEPLVPPATFAIFTISWTGISAPSTALPIEISVPPVGVLKNFYEELDPLSEMVLGTDTFQLVNQGYPDPYIGKKHRGAGWDSPSHLNPNVGLLGEQGLTALDGLHSLTVDPVSIVTDLIFPDQIEWDNYYGQLGHTRRGAPLATGEVGDDKWMYTVDMGSGVPGEDLDVWFFSIHEDGAMSWSTDVNMLPFDEHNYWFKARANPAENPFDTNVDYIQDTTNDTKGIITGFDSITGLNAYLFMVFTQTYPTTQLAYARNQLVNAKLQNEPGQFGHEPGECDLQIEVSANNDNTVASISVWQMQGANNQVNFPIDGWKDTNEVLDYVDLTTIAGMAGFTYGVDSIQLNLYVSAHFALTLAVSYQVPGAPAPVAPAVIVTDDGDTRVPADFRSFLRESHYPIKPIIYYGSAYPFNSTALGAGASGGFGSTRLLIENTVEEPNAITWREENRSGGFNGRLIEASRGLLMDENINNDTMLQDIDPLLPDTTQPIIIKMGDIPDHMIIDPDGIAVLPPVSRDEISYFDAEPYAYHPDATGRGEGDFLFGPAQLLGMNPTFLNEVPAGAGDVESSVAPLLDVTRPTIQVEIPELNTKSYSGASNDAGRAVGVVPSEEWNVNAVGINDTLHYSSNYSRPVEMNMANTQPIYSLTCRLRDTTGKVTSGLRNPTTATFLIKESDETKQQRVMDKAMARLSQLSGEKQSANIANFNRDVPIL